MKNRLFLYYLPALAYAGVIFALSSVQHLQLPNLGISWTDKIAHFLEYAVFGFFMVRAFFYGASPEKRRRALWLAFFISLAYAGTDEIHQIFVPGREASVLDWLADSVGIAFGHYIFSHWKLIENRFRHLYATK